MKRSSFIFLLVSMMLLMGKPVLAGQGSPDAPVNLRITITPLQGNPGAVISVSGSGADPALKVFVTLSPQADSATGALATVEATPASNGTFTASLTIPAGTTDGYYAVRAEQFSPRGSVLQYYWNGFIVGSGGAGPLLPGAGGVPEPALPLVTTGLALLLVMGLIVQGVAAVRSNDLAGSVRSSMAEIERWRLN
jgi:hypothetical protein